LAIFILIFFGTSILCQRKGIFVPKFPVLAEMSVEIIAKKDFLPFSPIYFVCQFFIFLISVISGKFVSFFAISHGIHLLVIEKNNRFGS
jgi:hypothetical protein